MTAPDGSAPDRPQRTFTPDFLTALFRDPLDPGYRAAAERKARGEGPTGVRKKALSGVTALSMIALGFLLVIAWQQTTEEEPARARARAELVEQIQNRRSTTEQLQERADSLRGEVADLRESQLGGETVARLQELEAQTGLAPVRGSGARITVGDGPTAVDPVTGQSSSDSRVRDTDLQRATNALWALGAEAIAINGQRLTATSTIRQAGEAVLVDFQPVTTPYQVVAIGPGSLAESFGKGAVGRFFEALKTRYGISYDVSEVENVTLDAATEPNLRQASPSVTPSASLSAPSGSTDSPGSGAGTAPETTSTPSEGGR